MNQPINKCGCGRSPTGFCVGWHNLTNEDYQKKLSEYQLKEQKLNEQIFLREDK